MHLILWVGCITEVSVTCSQNVESSLFAEVKKHKFSVHLKLYYRSLDDYLRCLATVFLPN